MGRALTDERPSAAGGNRGRLVPDDEGDDSGNGKRRESENDPQTPMGMALDRPANGGWDGHLAREGFRRVQERSLLSAAVRIPMLTVSVR